MNILHVCVMDTPAGLENRVHRFHRATEDQFNNHFVIVNEWVHPKFEDDIRDGDNVYHFKYARKWLKKPGFLRNYFLERWVREKRFDAILVYSTFRTGLIDTLLDAHPDAFSAFYEGGAAWFEPDDRENKELLRRFDRCIATSSATEVILEEKFDVPRSKIPMARTSISEEDFERFASYELTREEERELAPFEGTFNLLALSRVIAKKGTNILIRALSFLPKNFHLWIVGDGHELPSMKRLVNELDVSNRVTFFGFRTKPAPFLKKADLMVVPSVSEPLGNIFLEAGAASLPALASKIDGIPDVIHHEETGYLVKPEEPLDRFMNDFSDFRVPRRVVDPESKSLVKPQFLNPEKLAKSIRTLAEDEEELNRLGKNLHREVQTNFLMNETIEKIKHIVLS